MPFFPPGTGVVFSCRRTTLIVVADTLAAVQVAMLVAIMVVLRCIVVMATGRTKSLGVVVVLVNRNFARRIQ